MEAGSTPRSESDAGFLLGSKLSVPRSPPHLVRRPRLIAALEAGTEGPFTLITGGAGAGKTALVTSWLDGGRVPGPVAWVSLDPVDNGSRLRFWRLIVQALGTAGIDVGIDLVSSSSQATIDHLLDQLRTALEASPAPVVLLLDDFGLIDDPTTLADVYQLLREPSPKLRIVATARSVPQMRLQRLRLAGVVTEIGPADLAFTREEADELLSNVGVGLAPEVAERLWETTEGWGAGLQLAALALQHHPRPEDFVAHFAGDVFPISDYLLEEVLSIQPFAVRTFLLETSVVDTVCGGLADAITGGSGGGGTLEELERSGLLATALDDQHEWHRYHGLLLDMLRATMRRERPEMLPALHRRAARWLLAHEREADAAHHAIAAGDVELLVDIVADRGFALLVRGKSDELAQSVQELPLERLGEEPMLTLSLAGASVDAGDARGAARWLQWSDERADLLRPEHRPAFRIGRAIVDLHQSRMDGALDEAHGATQTIVQAASHAAVESTQDAADLRALAFLLLGGLELWMVSNEIAQRNLTRGLSIAVANDRPYLALYGAAHLSMCHAWSGQLSAGAERAGEALRIAERSGWRHTPRTATALAALGSIALARGALAEAGEHLAQAAEIVEEWQDRPLHGHICVGRAKVLRLSGQPEQALDALASVRPKVGSSPFLAPLLETQDAEEAMALAALGRTEDAIELLERANAQATRGEIPVALAAMRLAARDPAAALDLASPWTPDHRGSHAPLTTSILALIVTARARRRMGEDEAADAAMVQAVSLAIPESCRGPFLETGPPVVAELQRLLGRSTPAVEAFAREAMTLVEAPPEVDAPAPAATPAPLNDPLSDRELMILRFLPGDSTNADIASELFVSVNTVKSHVKQIYRKLDVHDRREAVVRARELGLIPSGLAARPITRPR